MLGVSIIKILMFMRQIVGRRHFHFEMVNDCWPFLFNFFFHLLRAKQSNNAWYFLKKNWVWGFFKKEKPWTLGAILSPNLEPTLYRTPKKKYNGICDPFRVSKSLKFNKSWHVQIYSMYQKHGRFFFFQVWVGTYKYITLWKKPGRYFKQQNRSA